MSDRPPSPVQERPEHGATSSRRAGRGDARDRPRSLPGHLRWRAALVEGFAVLAGVLLAFGINAWWEGHQDRARELAHLRALRIELLATRDALAAHTDHLTEDMGLVRHYMSAVVDGDPSALPTDTIDTMIRRFGPFRVFAPPRAAFDDLINSGGYRLVRSDSLRRALTAFEQSVARDREAQDEVRTFWWNEMRPYNTRNANLTRIFPGGRIADDLTVPTMPVSTRRDAYAGNRTYASLITTRAILEMLVRNRHRQMDSLAVEVLELIDGELESGPPAAGS